MSGSERPDTPPTAVPAGRTTHRAAIRGVCVLTGLLLGACEVVGGIDDRVFHAPIPDRADAAASGGASAGGRSEQNTGGRSERTAGVVNQSGGSGAEAAVYKRTQDAGEAAEASTNLDGSPEVRIVSAIADASRVPVFTDQQAARDGSQVQPIQPDSRDACVTGTVENCADGVDNNCDGLVDCADPTCRSAGYECIPLPPGWVGPAVIWTGKPGSAPATCSPGLKIALPSAYSDLTVPQMSCKCGCSIATPQSCGAFDITLFGNDACGSRCASGTAQSGVCSAIASDTTCGAAIAVSGTTPAASGGSCAPQLVASIPAATWRTELRICAPVDSGSAAGCASPNGRCAIAPRPEAPYRTTLCVYQIGDPAPTSCPAGYPTGPLVFHSSMRDTRACSICSCNRPTGGVCSGTVALYHEARCGGTAERFSIGAACRIVRLQTGTATSFVGDFSVQQPGTCSVQSDTLPSGTVQGIGATTVCCAS